MDWLTFLLSFVLVFAIRYFVHITARGFGPLGDFALATLILFALGWAIGGLLLHLDVLTIFMAAALVQAIAFLVPGVVPRAS